MSFSQQTRLVYIPAQELPFPYKALPAPAFTASGLSANLGIDVNDAGLPDEPTAKAAVLATANGHLAAWDPVQQKEVWRVSHQGPWNGGVLSTAGNLVFQGTASGSFAAYAADTGRRLWSFPTQTGVMAPPITYRVADVQYVALVVGWGGTYPLLTGELAFKSGPQVNRSRLLVFTLDGKSSLPPVDDVPRPPATPPALEATPAHVERGATIYNRYCGPCHGGNAFAGGVLPDLRVSPALQNRDTWRRIVIDGILERRGMVGFGKELTPDDAEALRAYVATRARLTR
jgi:alcohol dehydrogenase (cytochrome c)/quinohemoprotein ethanol dehydrogenase